MCSLQFQAMYAMYSNVEDVYAIKDAACNEVAWHCSWSFVLDVFDFAPPMLHRQIVTMKQQS